MTALVEFPFRLPDRFLDQLGYPRVVEAFESPAIRAHLAELLRRQGIAVEQAAPTGPQRYIMLHWEAAGDELAFSDGAHRGAGQLNHWAYLDYRRRGPIYGWLVEHQVDLGSSAGPATHALIVDAESNTAWVAPIALAHRIVRKQALDLEAQP